MILVHGTKMSARERSVDILTAPDMSGKLMAALLWPRRLISRYSGEATVDDGSKAIGTGQAGGVRNPRHGDFSIKDAPRLDANIELDSICR